jgi:hypothetical protein
MMSWYIVKVFINADDIIGIKEAMAYALEKVPGVLKVGLFNVARYPTDVPQAGSPVKGKPLRGAPHP